MPMFKQQLASILEIAVGDVDERLAEVRQRKEELLLHALPIPVRNFINPAFWIELIGEETLFVAELFSEEGVDKRNVVVNAPRLEDLFAAESQPQIPLAF